MYTHTHIYKIKGIGVTKTSSSAFASGKQGVRSVLSLSPRFPLFSPALNGIRQPGWEWVFIVT